MENLNQLQVEESIVFNGGTNGVYDDGRGDSDCIPDPLGDFIRKSTLPNSNR